MERFIERYQDRILGVLSGFDRMLFRGTLRSLSYVSGMDFFLASQGILYKDFGAFVDKLSTRIKEHAEAVAKEKQRPYRYLESSDISKDEVAQRIMKQDQIREGLVCVLSCVEPCQSYSIHKNREQKLLELKSAYRKCLHVYFYFVDKEFGLMHVRLQTWAPYPIQVCLNGREYLARQLDQAGIGYEQRDNCFIRIDNLPRAQALLDQLVKRKWPRLLQKLARRLNPLFFAKSGLDLRPYYWTWRQGEWATDVMFRDAQALHEIYPTLLHHGITQFGCQQVLRFLSKRVTCRFNGEARTELKHRPEGTCLKHWVEENSIKMYDKQGSILRIETTINNPRRFKVRRRVTQRGHSRMACVRLRKSVADIPRLVKIAQAANQRYLQALALVNVPQPVHRVLDPVSRRITKEGRPYRALRPVTKEEAEAFKILVNGAFRLQGFRNPQVRKILFPDADRDPRSCRQASGRVTRLFRLLRAHGLIRKVTGTRYYRVTDKGIQVMTTALQLRQIDLGLLAA